MACPVSTTARAGRLLRHATRRLRAGWRSIAPDEHDVGARRRRLFVRQVQEALREGRDADALRLAEAGVEELPASLQLADCLVATLDRLGEHDRALEVALANARRRAQRLAARRPAATGQRTLDREHRIFLSGFFYSGSGAVLDHLRGLPDTGSWTPHGEMRLLKFPGGLHDLTRRHRAAGGLQPRDLVDLYLHVTGWKAVYVPRGHYDQWSVVNRQARRLFSTPQAAGYLAACLDGIVTLAERCDARQPTARQLRSHFQTMIARALDAAATDLGADRLLIDQAATAWRLNLARLLPPSTFIVVHRDPRDQYSEVQQVLAQPGRAQRSAAEFSAQYRKRQAVAATRIEAMERDQGHRVLRLSFEEFVVDHAMQARRLHEWLGLDAVALREPRFDPQRSRTNVGKHAGLLDPADVATIADALPEFLSPHATPLPH